MRPLVIAALSLVLLSGCAQDSSSSTSAGTLDAAGTQAVTSLTATTTLSFDDADSIRLLGVCRGYEGTGEPTDLSRFDLTVPATIDGVAAEIIFPLRVDDGTVMRDATGTVVPRHEQFAVLDEDIYGDCDWTAAAHRQDGRLLAMDLAVVESPESPSPDETESQELRSLVLEGVLPFDSNDTFDLVGVIMGSESASDSAEAPVKLGAVDFVLPMAIDGVETDVTLRVVVDDETLMLDEAGKVVPRLEHDAYEGSNFHGWLASLRKRGDELVAVELRVLEPTM